MRRRGLARALRRAARLAFAALLVTLPLAQPVARIDRPGSPPGPVSLSSPIYLSDVLLAGLLLCWASQHALAPERALRLPARPLMGALLSLAAVAVVSPSWALVPAIAAVGALRWLLLLGLLVYVVDAVRWYRPVAVCLTVAGALQAVLRLGPVLARSLPGLHLSSGAPVAGTPLGPEPVPPPGAVVGGLGAWLAPTQVQGLLLVVGLLALAGLLATERRPRPWQLAALGLMATGLAVTPVPAAWLGLALGLALVSVVGGRPGNGMGVRAAAAVVGLTAAGVAGLVLAIGPALDSSWAAGSGPAPGHVQPAGGEPAALAVWRRRPLGGVGIGNQAVAAALMGTPAPGAAAEAPTGGTPWVMAAELGLPGGALWLALWALVLTGIWYGRARLGGRKHWWLVWSSAVVALGLFCWRDAAPLAFPQGGALLWAVLGLWASAAPPHLAWRLPRLPRAEPAPARGGPCRRDVSAFGAVALAAGLVLVALCGLFVRTRGPFLWDPASFALAGAEVWSAARQGAWTLAAQAAGRAEQYPPGYPVLAAIWFGLTGLGQAQARLFSLAWLGLAVALAFWLAWWLAPTARAGRRAGLVCAALLLSAPTLIYLSTDAVLEPVGAGLTLASLAAAALGRAPSRPAWLAVAGALAAVTCLVKYNYGLPLVLALVLLTVLEATPAPLRRRRLAVLAATAVLPVAVWLAGHPEQRLSGLIAFAVNRSSGLGLVAGLATYPGALLWDYAAAWWIGLGLAIAAVVGIRRHWRDPRFQPAIAYVLVFLALALVHPYKQPRFLFPAVPVLMVLASIVLGTAPWPSRRHWRQVALVAPVLAVLAAGGLAQRLLGYQRGVNEWLNYAPAARRTVESMLGFVVSHVDPRQGVLVNGVSNELSAALLAWWWRAEQGVEPVHVYGLPYVGPIGRQGRLAAPTSVHAGALRDSLLFWRPASVVSVTVAPESRFFTPDYAQWNLWQVAYDVAIAQEATLRRRHEAWFDAGRIHVVIYCRAGLPACR